MSITTFMSRLGSNLINPLMALMFVVALLLFFWGVVKFLYYTDDEEAKKVGQKNMLWGLIGIAIMISIYGILSFIVHQIPGAVNPFEIT